MDIVRGLLGIGIMVGIMYLLSSDRKRIDWKLVSIGIGLQIVLAIVILKVPILAQIFDGVAKFFVNILEFSDEGADFVLGDWPVSLPYETTDADGNPSIAQTGYLFAFKVLPTIIFFSAVSALLYYLGVLQKIIYGLAWLMARTMGLSGPESLAAAANVFIGQTEAPLVVRPYLDRMSKSEILCLMVGGMATIAGGVFAAYIGFLGGEDQAMREYFATHLLTASIISAPAAIVAAKMLQPETEDFVNRDLTISKQDVGSNVFEAISNGTTDGLKLAINVGAMLLVFTALMGMLNSIFLWVGDLTNINESIVASTDGRFEGLSFTYILGLLFAPFAWLIGTPSGDLLVMGQLLGTKTVINEFVAYGQVPALSGNMNPKSVIIATYALCGFANFASIGIQIGGIGALAPNRRKLLSELGIKALIGGTIATLMTASIAGVLYGF